MEEEEEVEEDNVVSSWSPVSSGRRGCRSVRAEALNQENDVFRMMS